MLLKLLDKFRVRVRVSLAAPEVLKGNLMLYLCWMQCYWYWPPTLRSPLCIHVAHKFNLVIKQQSWFWSHFKGWWTEMTDHFWACKNLLHNHHHHHPAPHIETAVWLFSFWKYGSKLALLLPKVMLNYSHFSYRSPRDFSKIPQKDFFC